MISFQVVRSYEGQLDVLSEYASHMWKLSNGKVTGQISQDALLEAHQDGRLKAVDRNEDLPEKFLIIQTDRV